MKVIRPTDNVAPMAMVVTKLKVNIEVSKREIVAAMIAETRTGIAVRTSTKDICISGVLPCSCSRLAVSFCSGLYSYTSTGRDESELVWPFSA